MKPIPFFQIDAFAAAPFTGNPAAVCLLENWLPDAALLAVAQENNLPETAYLVPVGLDYALRWFTPQLEIDLCGHATLAAAHALYAHAGYDQPELRFHTRQVGDLLIRRLSVATYQLDFPVRSAVPCANVPPQLLAGLGNITPHAVLANHRDYMVVLESAAAVQAVTPDFALLKQLDKWTCVTAPGVEEDFVSRFFTPGDGYDEDPVTGSTHCMLVPYWAARLGKTEFVARQLSPRGGMLLCALKGGRVLLGGTAVTVISGHYHLPDMV